MWRYGTQSDMRCSISLSDSPRWMTSSGTLASLCAEWRIRDVLAHVTAGAEGAFGVAAIIRWNASPRLQLQPMGGS